MFDLFFDSMDQPSSSKTNKDRMILHKC